MTDILCRWLNEDVKVTTKLDVTNFAREFATGLLIGETLHKYQLLDDFDQFSQSKAAGAKLNNFTRLEPVLHLLGVNFDTNVARDIMSEKHGAATRLMYQLFIALHNKEKNNLTGTAIETMRPAGPVNLENITSGIYKERLKHMTPRQTDVNLDNLVAQFHEKQIQMESKAFKERFEEEERHIQQLQEKRQQLIQQYKENQAQKSEMLAKIQAATVHVPTPPANKTAKAIALRRQTTKLKEREEAMKDIAAFEEALHRSLPPSQSKVFSGELSEIEQERKDLPTQHEPVDLIKPKSNDEYVNKIRKRLNEDVSARSEREKRRRKVLVDQLKAHELQEEARREEMMVNRLMRQSQQERRIAVQLLHTRHEKEIIKRNRIMREKQHEERRLKEFEDALNREAEAARLAKLNYIEQIEKDKAMHNSIKEQRQREKYKKHYDECMETLLSIVDLVTKVGEYRELTNKLLPPKLMREWNALFVNGQPLYEADDTSAPKMTASEQMMEDEKEKLLNEGDFNEYRNMIGEWEPPEETGITGPPKPNPIIGHIVQRLFDIVQPPVPPPLAPMLPPFPVKACVLGKPFAGKTTCLQKLADEHRLILLDSETLVMEAVEAFENNETVQVTEVVSSKSVSGDKQQESAPPTAQSEKSGADGTTPRSTSEKPADEPKKQPDNKDVEEAQVPAATEDDGQEKGDQEKPVEEDIVQANNGANEQKASEDEEQQDEIIVTEQLSPKAKLGEHVSKLLKKGKPVDDSLLVDIIIEAIKNLSEGTGWILDGFPATYNQAKLLEKALSGLDSEGQAKANASMKKSLLAPNPRPKPTPPEPPSGIDVVILLDISDEASLKRAAGRFLAQQQGEQYQMEFKPPPHGSATGIAQQEQVVPVSDRGFDQEQLQHRLTAFENAWPKLEKWFSNFGTLKLVNANEEEENVYLEVEKLLQNVVNKEETVPETLTIETSQPPEPQPEEVVQETAPPAAAEAQTEEKPSTPAAEETKSRPQSGKSKSPSRSRPASKKDQSAKKSPEKKSREGTPKSPKRGKSGKKGKSPEPQPEPEPEGPPPTPPPAPGSEQWEYVDQPVEEELARILAEHWEIVENTYTNGAKTLFKQLRDERDNIIHYFYDIRRNFEAFLRRPDHKQEFVSQWQADYNSLSDDIRGDDETKWELHQRVDDLRERLWSICDERKEQAENEKDAVMAEGWLEDHLGILTNHYLSLMQTEVDRYQDSTRMLKDYYKAMDGKIPDELQPEYARLPLVELPVEDRPPSAAGSQTSSKKDPGTPTGSPHGSRPTTPKSGTPKKRSKQSTPAQSPVAEPDAENDKKRIPLIPRRPASPDQAAQAKAKADKGKPAGKGSKADGPETPPPPTDQDERLLYDGCVTAVAAVDKILHAEQAAREAEEEAERQAQLEKEKEKAAAAGKKGAKGGKKGKSRSPSPKKGAKDAPVATPPPDEEESEEEKQKKLMKEKAKLEYFAAIEEEAVAVKLRLELVKSIAMTVLQTLKSQADEAYKDMNDWLGARFLKEMESIDQLSEVVRSAIEHGTRLQNELVLQGEQFIIHEDVRVLRTPTPPPRPPAIEKSQADIYTVDQIFHLFSQFCLVAPNGTLTSKAFQEMFTDLAALTYGTEQLPESWANITPEKLEQISQEMRTNGEYIDWRAFLLAAAQPWPKPTQQELLNCLEEFQNMDQLQTGYVTREQYDRVELWFQGMSKPPSPDDPAEAYPYDRLGNLKMAFFDIFADNTADPPQLDYVNMLLYFCVAQDAVEGFVRALSVAVGKHMPRVNEPHDARERTATRPASQASVAASAEFGPSDTEGMEAEDIPESAQNSKVPLSALHKVLHHGQSLRGDTHRFSVTADPEDTFSQNRLKKVYEDLGCTDEEEGVLFTVLMQHPVMQDILTSFKVFKAMDLQEMLMKTSASSDAGNAQTSE